MPVGKVNLQWFVALCVHSHSDAYRRVFGGLKHPYRPGIVISVAVGKTELMFFVYPNGTPHRPVDVPIGHSRVGCHVAEIVVDRTAPCRSHGQGHAAHPDVFFVDAVGEPHVGVVRLAFSFGDPPYITGTEIFVLAHETAWWYFTVYHTHRVEADAVVACDGNQRITVGLGLDRVVADGIPAVACALSPFLSSGHDERGTSHRRRPRRSLVARQSSVRPFPKRHNLAVLTVEIGCGLHGVDGILQCIETVESAVFIYPLQGFQPVVEQGVTSCLESFVFRTGIKRV